MRNNYRNDARRIDAALATYERASAPLPGLVSPAHREAFIEQVIDSEQRVAYTDRLLGRELDPAAKDPRSPGFDPLRAAVIYAREGNYDEAVWLVYLFVHFGKHRLAGWRYVRDVYGAFGSNPGNWWTWQRTAGDPTAFRFWLDDHQDDFHIEPGAHGFGNHRKYVSLKSWTENGTGAAVESYVAWVLSAGGDHAQRFAFVKGMPEKEAFAALYDSLKPVIQFGRIAKFDYLTMLAKLKLVEITPPHSYLVGATGPLRGARLLLHADVNAGTAKQIQSELAALGIACDLRPDVLEDAVCNWQKSPDKYVRFSG